jgi:GNAT superfamily N-acetyltransferase
MNPITIRPAEESDTPLILSLIKDLASYERLLDEVVATEALLRESLFGKTRHAEVVLAYHDGSPAGYSLFFHNFSTFLGRSGIYIEDLYVKEAYRGKGLGKALFRYLAELAVHRGCGRLEFAVLDWNEPAIRFYRHFGANRLDDWSLYRITGSRLNRLAGEEQEDAKLRRGED